VNAIDQAKLEMRVASLESELAEEREKLRDRFAMFALLRIERGGAQWIGVQAYEIADAMLDERKQQRPKGAAE
jgi:hypothetical protein